MKPLDNIKTTNPAQIIMLVFAMIILAGAVLLYLPMGVRSGNFNTFIDALFTATSAVCVTGLVTVDTGTFYNAYGHMIIIMLVQIGGLGIISATTFSAVLFGKKIGLKEKILIKESMNTDSLGGVARLVKTVLITTIAIEGIGAVILSLAFWRYFPLPKAIWYGAFHSVSGFCSAGFDLLGQDYYPFCSLVPMQNDPVILATTAWLIILGGLGFITILGIMDKKNFHSLSMHNKLVISVTAILILAGWAFFFFSEGQTSFAHLGSGDKIVNAFLMSVTPRSGGLTSIDLAKTLPATQLMLMFLMFVGASPVSSGGGIKTTTFAILVLAVWSRVKAREDVEMFGRRVDKDTVYGALTIAVTAAAAVFISLIMMTLLDNHDVIALLFEIFSAWGTVGLSTGITPQLTTGAKIILIVLMFFGRLGPLTIALALMERRSRTDMKYPRGGVIIG